MVDKRIQTEILLELMLVVGGETNEKQILKKCLSLYLRKLNCFSATVLKKEEGSIEDYFHLPYAARNSEDWHEVRNYYIHIKPGSDKTFNEYPTKNGFYYRFDLDTYGYLIIGRKKSLDKGFWYDLLAVVFHLGKVLLQAQEIEHRKKVEFALKESERRLQLSLEVNKASAFEFNLVTGKIISTPDLYFHLGYIEEEIPKNIEEVADFVYEGDLPVMDKAIADHLSGKSSEYYCEFRMIAKNGDLVWVDGQGKLTEFQENGDPLILLGFSRDISKQKRTEEALIAAKEKAEESDRLKTSFLANMSHEIRTPMNGILGFAELLKQQVVSGEEQKEYIGIIERSGIRLLNIINDLIDISKVESGQMEIVTSDTEVNRQIKYIFKFFKVETEKKGLAFSLKIPTPEMEITLKTDREKLYAILTNLVKNAIKYTDKGSIELGYNELNSELIFYVKDTGVGIRKENQQSVFNRFIQADIANPRAYGGAGLGLSITKAYIEMLGGNIWMESKFGKGSSFFFSLPLIHITED